MGLFSVELKVAPLENPKHLSESVHVLVDTGATYPVIPENVLDTIGIKEQGSLTITLADGKQGIRKYGYAFCVVDGKRVPNMVIFGKPSDLAILGVTVLEQAGLSADPIHQKLIPIAPIQA